MLSIEKQAAVLDRKQIEEVKIAEEEEEEKKESKGKPKKKKTF